MAADVGPPRRRGFGTPTSGGRAGSGGPTESGGPAAPNRSGRPDLRDLSPEDRARELCLAALERRMRTRKELAQLLTRKHIPPEIAGPVLDRLQEVGLVNDEAYARAFVASRQRTKPRGGRALASELFAKGVPSEVIDRILEETTEAEDPLEAARRAVAPKLRTLAGKPPEEIRRKAEQFLLRRGFSYDVARAVLRNLGSEEVSEGGPDGQE